MSIVLSPFVHFHRIPFPIGKRLYEGSTTRLDSLNLGGAEGGAAEPSGELRDVKGNAAWGLDRAQAGSRGTANAAVGANRLLEGAVLLSVVAVGAEGRVCRRGRAVAVVSETLGERSAGRCRVRLGGVVDIGCEEWRVSTTVNFMIFGCSAASDEVIAGRSGSRTYQGWCVDRGT